MTDLAQPALLLVLPCQGIWALITFCEELRRLGHPDWRELWWNAALKASWNMEASLHYAMMEGSFMTAGASPRDFQWARQMAYE